AAAEQALATFEVDREASRDDVIDPCLDRARRAEVVERQAEQDRVCLLDLIDEPNRELPGCGLGSCGLFERDVPWKAAASVEVRDGAGAEVPVGDRAAEMRSMPSLGGARAQGARHRGLDTDARVDVEQMGHGYVTVSASLRRSGSTSLPSAGFCAHR